MDRRLEHDDRGIAQTVSMSQSRNRVQGRDGSVDWESSSTGSTGGGGVILEEAGIAETMLARKRRKNNKQTRILGVVFMGSKEWHFGEKKG